MKTLAEMAASGEDKLRRKAADMAASYAAAKTRMKAGYALTPFGPTRKGAYDRGVDAATYRAPDPSAWSRAWTAKMSE